MDTLSRHVPAVTMNKIDGSDPKRELLKTRWLSIEDCMPKQQMTHILRPAAMELLNGGLVVFPTETVYGLGVNPFLGPSVQNVYRAKGRPFDNPLILHISALSYLTRLVGSVAGKWQDLADQFWPGPMTFVFPKAPHVPNWVTGGRDTVAIRFPSHPVAQVLISECGIPLAAPSANRSGTPSLTRKEHLCEMEGIADWIIESGTLDFGLESTIISLVEDPPVLLRPGPITVEQIQTMIPDLVIGLQRTEAIAPGMKYRHYAPKASLTLIEYVGGSDSDLERMAEQVLCRYHEKNRPEFRVLVLCTDETMQRYQERGIPFVSLGSRAQPYSIGKSLFHAFRRADDEGYPMILIEGVEEIGIGMAIMNRIRKAIDGQLG